jgi:hypothetical protein
MGGDLVSLLTLLLAALFAAVSATTSREATHLGRQVYLDSTHQSQSRNSSNSFDPSPWTSATFQTWDIELQSMAIGVMIPFF